jgi:hypothetical protein
MASSLYWFFGIVSARETRRNGSADLIGVRVERPGGVERVHHLCLVGGALGEVVVIRHRRDHGASGLPIANSVNLTVRGVDGRRNLRDGGFGQRLALCECLVSAELLELTSAMHRQPDTTDPDAGSTTYTPRRRDTKVQCDGATEAGSDQESGPHNGQNARGPGSTSSHRVALGFLCDPTII